MTEEKTETQGEITCPCCSSVVPATLVTHRATAHQIILTNGIEILEPVYIKKDDKVTIENTSSTLGTGFVMLRWPLGSEAPGLLGFQDKDGQLA